VFKRLNAVRILRIQYSEGLGSIKVRSDSETEIKFNLLPHSVFAVRDLDETSPVGRR
jgi:hypothetical protein